MIFLPIHNKPAGKVYRSKQMNNKALHSPNLPEELPGLQAPEIRLDCKASQVTVYLIVITICQYLQRCLIIE
jgi:hypothetical protein